jgi:pyrroline-5-carboxylate reductase
VTAVAAAAPDAGESSFILTTMQIGIIGAGNMACALARGWGEPVLVFDVFRPRADALAEELGGEVAASPADLARRADVVVLCHKPAGLERVASALGGAAKGVVSILGGVPLSALKAAYGGTPVVRMLPSVPVEVRQGVSVHARDAGADPELEALALELFGRVGTVVTIDEPQIDAAMGVMSCAPAYVALVAEAQIDAGVRAGLPADVAGELVGANLAGTAALLQARGMDTLAVRRSVTSPGGSTARGLAALEHAGVRAAFDDAMQAVLAR